jgi:hypothetical protein
MNSLLIHVYDVVALAGAFVSIYVMQKTESDKINMIDPMWLQWSRRSAFGGISSALAYSVYNSLTGDWIPTTVVLALVLAGVVSLAINAIALYLRSTPTGRRAVKVRPHAIKGVGWR